MGTATDHGTGSAPGRRKELGGVIVPCFEDPYLELVRLLREGAGLEHTLLVTYLFSLFSLKARYADVRGSLSESSYLERNPFAHGASWGVYQPETFLDLALEEMQHLDLVNRFLCDLAVSPTLMPHTFPDVSDIYPFTITPAPLSRWTTATFLWAEADACALSASPDCAGRQRDPALAAEVRQVLRDEAPPHHEPIDFEPVSHLGSLYHRVVEVARIVRSLALAGKLSTVATTFAWDEHIEAMLWLTEEGEIAHFDFFRSLFTGEAFGGDASVWSDPGSEVYPSVPLRWESAYPGRRRSIEPEPARRIAWLSDLCYWTVLALLDLRYHGQDRVLQYLAIDVMTQGFWPLAELLAEGYGFGPPFDRLGPQYDVGRDASSARAFISLLAGEAKLLAAELSRAGLLPEGFAQTLLERVQAALAG
ncbi:MAG TPA: ferritin-like domain-containing protein [Acidimicrobiales bacterium]|nr:ferritin-like domain-containing protein [Acidimicrobiales bacterium]